MAASLTSGGETIVRGKSAGDEIVVDVAVGGMDESFGAEITFAVDPPNAATRTGLDANNLQVLEEDGMSVTLAGTPVPRGAYGSVTFTAATDEAFSISVTSFNVLAREGKKAVDVSGASLMVNKPLPTLMGPDGDVMIMPGGEAMAMVTAAGFDGDVTFDGAEADGSVTADAPGEVTVTATDGIDPASASVTINFVWGPLTLTASDADPVKPGGSSSVMLTVEGAAEGATVMIASSDDAVTVSEDGTMASASGAATATLTATVDGVSAEEVSATADVAFEWGPLTLTASDADPVKPGGSSSVTLTVEGAAEGADVAITSDNEAVMVSEDGTMASASGPATATLTATVGAAPPATADVAFVWGELTLTADATEVAIGADGAMATLTASGQADGADVVFEGATENDDGVSATVSASVASTATVTASFGDVVMSNAVEVSFVPSLATDMTEVTIPRDGPAMVTATAYGFPADAEVNFVVTAGTDVVSSDDGSTLTLTKSTPGDVTAFATDGTITTAELRIAFVSMPPELVSDAADDMAEIPVGGSADVVITALDFGEEISYQTEVTEGVATVDSKRDGANLMLKVSGTGSATVVVTANDGTNTDAIEIKFTAAALELTAGKSEVMVPVGGTGSTTVTASGQAEGAEVAFTVEGEGVTHESDGATVTVSASGAATATVTAAVGGVSATTTVEFVDGALTLALAEGSEAENTVLPGGSASATVELMNLAEGDEASFTVEKTEGVTAEEGDTAVTLTASGAGSATVSAMVNGLTTGSVTVAFVQGELTLALAEGSEAENTVLPGGSASAMFAVSGQAEGAEVAFRLEEGSDEGATLDGATVTASGAGTAMVTAWVGGVESNVVTVAFVQGPLTLSASDPDPVKPGGSSSATLTVEGQAEGAEVTIASDNDAVTISDDGAMASASGAAEATLTATVGGVSATTTVAFAQAPLMLAGDTEAYIPYSGTGSAMLTASGHAEGVEVMFTVEGEGVTSESDGASVTVSASAATTAMVTASVGDVMSETVEVAFMDAPPELRTETPTVTFADFGETGEATVTAVGFPEDATIRFRITGGAGFATADGAATWTVSTDKAGVVTLEATDGTSTTAELAITFLNPDPYLTADPESADAIIPTGGTVTITVTATGLGDDISWTASEVTGTASVDIETDGATAMLTAVDAEDISGTSTVTLIASDGTLMTAPLTVTFRKMPTLTPVETVEVPQAVVPEGTATVVAVGFAEGTEVTFSVEVTSGSESYLSQSSDGNVLTLTATGTVTVSVTATGVGITTDAVEVSFEQALPAAPASVVVQDQEGDNGYYVMLSFANSANHADVSQYRVYREMMVNTTMDAEGNVVTTDEPVAKWVPWAVIDAMDNDDEEGMTRAVVPVTDSNATRWGVAAEKGQDSAEITPAGKRVFSKESVQLMAQFLGLDPNLIVSQDELSEMFMPSADYISSIINGRQNVVFAALDPDMSVLIGGDVSVPQNIRTDHGPIVSSSITATEGMVAAIDDTAPAAVTDVAADAETGMVTWTMSADDMVVGMINYRGYAMPIPGVTGYMVRGGASPDAMIDIGPAPAGATSFQVPLPLIESLINQGLPAVLVTVVAMDGTNMTPSVPLVVELIPTRKPFVDEDGGPVYIVKLDRHGAMTPLTVDFEDFVAFTMAYNTDETHENWRVFVQADLNDDKMVNFDDFILFFSSYGKEAQGPAGKSLVTPSLGVNEAAELTLRLGSDRVVVGETMFVDVSLANVQALMGYGFVLNYDAEKFEFVEAMPAAEDFLTSSGGETPLFRGWSPESGQVHVTNTIANGSEVSGNGDIVRLVFRVLRDFQDDARFEIAEGLVFDPSQFANPLVGGVLDIQTTPTEFALLQNFPNPFNPETTIGYELAESADVTLQIYNVVGQVVRTLIASESQSIGRYQVRWDGMDDRGMPVSSGIYFYQLSAGKFQDVRKLMLLK